jgi:hypothetical protein
MDTQLPRNGQIIVFSKVPVGSWATAGEAYAVDRPNNKGDFRFVSVVRGSSTYDRPWTVAKAQWQLA